MRPLDSVAIAYELDETDDLITLHKHGEPERIRAWVENAKSKLSSAGEIGQSMAEQIKVIEISGTAGIGFDQSTIELLNQVIERNQRALARIVQLYAQNPDDSNTIDVQAFEVQRF